MSTSLSSVFFQLCKYIHCIAVFNISSTWTKYMHFCWSCVVYAELGLWPEGQYALPRPVYDCPSQSLHNWTTGMAMIQLGPRTNNTASSSWSANFHHLGTNEPKEFIITTCAKGREGPVSGAPTEKNKHMWPQGNYCIYKIGDDCPKGWWTKFTTPLFILKQTGCIFSKIITVWKVGKC